MYQCAIFVDDLNMARYKLPDVTDGTEEMKGAVFGRQNSGDVNSINEVMYPYL